MSDDFGEGLNALSICCGSALLSIIGTENLICSKCGTEFRLVQTEAIVMHCCDCNGTKTVSYGKGEYVDDCPEGCKLHYKKKCADCGCKYFQPEDAKQ